MSRENVELHRRLAAAFNVHDVDAFIAGFDPQIEFHSRFAAVGGVTVYRGHDGLRSWTLDVEEVWGEGFRLEVEAYYDLASGRSRSPYCAGPDVTAVWRPRCRSRR